MNDILKAMTALGFSAFLAFSISTRAEACTAVYVGRNLQMSGRELIP